VFGKAVQNFKESFVSLMNFLGDIIKFIGWVLPWALVAAFIPTAVYFYRKHKRSKNGSDDND